MPLQLIVLDTILTVALLIVIYTDARHGKIYNWVTFPTIGLGIGINAALGHWDGLKLSLLGLLAGLGIQFLPWQMGLAKAGDVKLLAAVGALKGWHFLLFGFLYGAAIHGLIAIPYLAARGFLRPALRNMFVFLYSKALFSPSASLMPASKIYMPWGIGLSLGFLLAMVLELVWGRVWWG
ncbi:MAG: A24 family peptidase [Abditibacteriales bacterium]|nr:A24 family peptidase [Abditibacteriales bacterium]MDW8365170.1 A24 family peptidase [Abditibacteriales bacterium]